MAITSIGYPAVNPASPQPGDFIKADQWAVMESLVGVKCAVVGGSDFMVTASTAQDRAVSVSAGSVFACGVLSTSDSAEIRAAGSATSGTVRYDTVVARFVWGTTKATSLVIVPGGSANAVASSLVRNPGVQWDVPLALIRVTGGQTAVQVVNDLRIRKTYSYGSDDARAFDVAPADHLARFASPDGSVYEYRVGAGWQGISKPGHVWDKALGLFLPLVISDDAVVDVGGSSGAPYSGSVIVPLKKQYAFSERYVWTADNGDYGAQDQMWIRGVVPPPSGPIKGIAVSYAQAKGGKARITVTGLLRTASFT